MKIKQMEVKQMFKSLFSRLTCLAFVLCLSILFAHSIGLAQSSNPILATLNTQPKIIIRSDELMRFIQLKYNNSISNQFTQSSNAPNAPNTPKIPVDLKAELNALIELHLLAHQAKALKIDQLPEMIDLSKKLSITYYLKYDFEFEFSLDRLPQKYIDQSYEQNQVLFNHDEMRSAVHVVFLPYQQKYEDLSKEEKLLIYEEAKLFYESLKNENQPLSFERFVQLGESTTQAYLLKIREASAQENPKKAIPLFLQSPKLNLKIEARYESLGTFSKQGPFVAEFIEAVFQMKKAGQYSDIFETSFGYYIVFLKEIIPPLSTPLDVAQAQIRKKILPEVRQFELNQLLDRQFRTIQPQIFSEDALK